MTAECPDIPFVDGVINAALTLPAWLRRFALTMQIVERQVQPLQGSAITARHQRAMQSFSRAKQVFTEIGEHLRAGGAETWRTWLLLTDPSSRAEGERLVRDAMSDGASAVDYAPLAHTFHISFDPAPLERHLRIRELAGGLSPQEIAAKLALYRQTRSKAEVLEFLETERVTLSSAVTSAGYAFLLVTALADAGQLNRADEVLTVNAEAFGDDFHRLRDQIRARRGEDVSASFEDRYLATNADVDLQALCDSLVPTTDLDKLYRYSLELFRRQPNRHNALRVCDALARSNRNREILDFLATADDLVAIDDDLASLKAWSHFTSASSGPRSCFPSACGKAETMRSTGLSKSISRSQAANGRTFPIS